jgi:hypothetical protein
MDDFFNADEDLPKGGVVWIYDNDICDTMEDVQQALKQIGVDVNVTLVASDRERCDFLFEKVEQGNKHIPGTNVLTPGAVLQMEDLKVPDGPWEVHHIKLNKRRPLSGK